MQAWTIMRLTGRMPGSLYGDHYTSCRMISVAGKRHAPYALRRVSARYFTRDVHFRRNKSDTSITRFHRKKTSPASRSGSMLIEEQRSDTVGVTPSEHATPHDPSVMATTLAPATASTLKPTLGSTHSDPHHATSTPAMATARTLSPLLRSRCPTGRVDPRSTRRDPA